MSSPRIFVLAFAAVLFLGGSIGVMPAWAQTTASAPVPTASSTLSRAEMETFLSRAEIVERNRVDQGITGTMRVTLTDGAFTHDASVQRIDERRLRFETERGSELNFRDTWKFNVAAYLLDKLLDINMIPATVERRIDRTPASFTWWVDDVLIDERERLRQNLSAPDPQRWNDQMFVVRLFDNLIYNTDRNLGNLLITKAWRIWMIDHGRAFRRWTELRTPGDLARGERRLLAKLRELDRPRLEQALGPYLERAELDGLWARRDLILTHFDRAGNGALYDAPRWP